MKSTRLPLFKRKNIEWYKSPPISLKEVNDICKQSNSPWFKLIIMKNKYKEEGDTRPEFVFYISTDKY